METWAQNQSVIAWLAVTTGVAAIAYALLVVNAWLRYGRIDGRPVEENTDPLLDRFLREYEVRERHHIEVEAPAVITYEVACTADLTSSGTIRAIFRLREWILGAAHHEKKEDDHAGLVAQAKAQGWGVLSEIPGRAIVMGAVTQPWAKNVAFRAISPEHFSTFREPGYVKILWTLRVDPKGPRHSVHSTETRACATDETARTKFRRYWAFFSPGIVLIRQIAIRLVRAEAERAARANSTSTFPARLKAGAAHRH